MQEQSPTEQRVEPEASRYREGDCVVHKLGLIELKDGTEMWGAILRFPAGPPKLPLRVVWDGTPLLLTPREG